MRHLSLPHVFLDAEQEFQSLIGKVQPMGNEDIERILDELGFQSLIGKVQQRLSTRPLTGGRRWPGQFQSLIGKVQRREKGGGMAKNQNPTPKKFQSLIGKVQREKMKFRLLIVMAFVISSFNPL